MAKMTRWPAHPFDGWASAPFRLALAPLMRAWVILNFRDLENIPRPSDAPQAHSAGLDSDRVLLFGSGPLVGWGVLSHDLGVPGALARALTRRTGRVADVDVIADPQMLIGSAVGALDGARLCRYDAIVVFLGVGDAVFYTATSLWRRAVADLLARLERSTSQTTQVYIVEASGIRSIPIFDSVLGTLAERHAQRLNRITRAVCAPMQRATLLSIAPDLPERSQYQDYRAAPVYEQWAELLAAVLTPALDPALHRHESGEADPSEPDALRSEARRQRAVDELDRPDPDYQALLGPIVELALTSFGADGASFSIVGAERVRMSCTAGLDRGELPRADSFCTLVIRESGATVIPDARADERFRTGPTAAGRLEVRFYAGFPIESPSGERIGALCVFGAEPRAEADVNLVLLRELALTVQSELARQASHA
ncbi:GAF domain-containing protein [Cryobacterium fucosi]|uniref:GAF domain-containing protein n=1 Tax=Cryobacterium fucosi TaxID=1259157 RepID=A0A4R9B797_9MICO|nr:GAF domain-containing protein [Cryobacterium fucosi]TFD76957.1 GAF domain-containing protein [Cryobacterium fucosi]